MNSVDVGMVPIWRARLRMITMDKKKQANKWNNAPGGTKQKIVVSN